MDAISLADITAMSLPVLMGTAFAMGGLHGLEPGHSKTLMAAFIIAVHGTVGQAIVLGLSAAVSHSAIVWILGLLAAAYGEKFMPDALEPWFMIASGLTIVVVGCWIVLRMVSPPAARTGGDCEEDGRTDGTHGHDHDHDHGHDHRHGHDHPHPHGHAHAHPHGHAHDSGQPHTHPAQDAHAQAHARAIEEQFASGHASLGQTVLFGLSGGLIPCPAAITVLIICLHLNKLALGFAVVSAFSLGLAATLVLIGVLSAVGLRAARRRAPRLDAWFARTPYLSGGLILAIGLVMTIAGWRSLSL